MTWDILPEDPPVDPPDPVDGGRTVTESPANVLDASASYDDRVTIEKGYRGREVTERMKADRSRMRSTICFFM